MKPVDQTIFGTGNGNCFAACVASILELPIEEVPNFCVEYPEPQNWYAIFRGWCAARGVLAMPVVSESNPAAHALYVWSAEEFPTLPYIVTGQTKFGPHCVVFQAGAPIHDPNPRHQTRDDFSEINMVLFLVRAP